MDWLMEIVPLWVYFVLISVFVLFGMWKLTNVDQGPRSDPSKHLEPDVDQGKASLTNNIDSGGFNH